jgi:two-component system chemotaxis sensor kinase CheA
METMSDDEAMQLIFASGLSTSAIVTGTSGRGVGMDVVRKNVETLQGHVDVDSTLGQGTQVTLTLPLTLATTQELLVQVKDQIYGIPISAVERILRINPQDIAAVEGKEAILVDNDPVSLVRLSDVLELPQQEEKVSHDEKMPVIILGAGRKRIAFLVDGVVGQQESVVKSLGKQLSRVRNVAGVTILGTGQVIMTLNPADLIKSARGTEGRTTIATRVTQARVEKAERPTILVVDDSLTTLTLEKNILETSGYEVKVATDGVEALSILQSDNCDLVVSDILMPRMDGFELTTLVRGDHKLKEIPVILVTSLESREDKERGIEVGADAYIVKSTFDQEGLLQTVEQLI